MLPAQRDESLDAQRLLTILRVHNYASHQVPQDGLKLPKRELLRPDAPLPDIPSSEQFWRLFGREEHTLLDFKTRADGIGDTVVSMANAEGGTIVIGIRDDRTIAGIADLQQTLDRISDAIETSHLLVTPAVEHRQVDGKTLVFVRVPRQLDGVAQTSNGRLLRRAGSRDRPLLGEALMSFLQAQQQTSGEDDAVPGAGAADLDERAVAAFLRARGTRRRVTRATVLDVLVDLRLAERRAAGVVPLTAAVLLFARRPERFLPRATVTFVQVPYPRGKSGPVRHTRREEISGAIPAAIDRAYAVVFEEMRKHSVVRGLLREDVPEYPPPAVREAIVNAVAHRDYRIRGSNVLITMFDDAIEVRSPGGLPAHVTVENIRTEQYSRNPKIMDALQRLRYVEQLGSGMDTIYVEMEKNLLREPELDATARAFSIVLGQQSLLSFDDKLWLTQIKDLPLEVEERKILVLARHQRSVTNADVRALLSCDRESALRLLRRLVDGGVLELIGKRGSSRYRLHPELGGAAADAAAVQQTEVLELARRAGVLRNVDVRRALGLESRAAGSLLRGLVRAGRLRQIGERRGTRYEAI